MAVNGIGFSVQYYYKEAAAKKYLGDNGEQWGGESLKETKGTFVENPAERNVEKLPEGRKPAIREKNQGAPYSYLANENGVIEYNGTVFTLNNEKKWLCCGNIDLNHMEQVIRIPLSEGGCLMVNRDNIDDLARAIGMFSPEDINRILRAIKLDGKIQQMKHEIEEMEDGIGKSSEEQNADSAESAKKAAEKSGKTDGFNGYENDEKEKGIFQLEEWQLKALVGESEASIPVPGENAEKRDEKQALKKNGDRV